MGIFTMSRQVRRLLLSTSALTGIALASTAQAGQPGLPSGGVVTAGTATIAQPNASQLNITTGGQRTVIDWQSFSIGSGNKVTIQQPGTNSITVNEVVGQNPSQIFGDLASNGRVVLANPNGIWFGPDSHVDVAGLVASTATLSDASKKAFAAGGHLSLDKAGKANASIQNDGHLTIAGAGLAALVAPGVRNNGVIQATLGTVQLASGTTATLDFYGDGLVAMAVTAPVQAVAIGPDGKAFKATIENNGKIKAGQVLVTADVVKGVVDNSINMGGVTEAKGVTVSGGDIILDGGEGDVAVAGTLDASSRQAKGGNVSVTGGAVTLAAASSIDASGATSGGTVQIGGGPHGGGSLKHATTVTVASGAKVKANATKQGDGGTVSVWSDGLTSFNGTISAKGAGTGKGGWIETSGHDLSIVTGSVDASAPLGAGGSWLLDPNDLTIDAAMAATIGTTLNGGTNVTEQTTLSGTGGSGDITVAAPINWSSTASLTLSAYRNIAVDAGLTSTHGGSVTLQADNTGTGTGTVSFASAAKVSTSGAVAIFYDPADNPAGSTVNDTSYASPTDYTADVAGGATLTASMLVNSVYDLQNVRNNLAGNYALGRNIDASATAGWNSGAGFTPIGNELLSSNFTGSLDGQGYTIANLTISDTGDHLIGLFGLTSGTIENLTLANVTIGAGTNSDTASDGAAILGAGGLAGENVGTITNVSVTGAVGDPFYTEFTAGGLVGINKGAITGSSSAVAVTSDTQLGGIAGTNSGTISQSVATGTITIGDTPFISDAGGLVGVNTGTVSQSNASGTVTQDGGIVTEAMGGLIGKNSGKIVSSFATGAVVGGAGDGSETDTGGLVGINSGTITGSYATGAVTSYGDDFAPLAIHTGGLVGLNIGTISQSYATGTVQFGNGGLNDSGRDFDSTGGLVGDNRGAIVSSYATGRVITDESESNTFGSAQYAGGLVGENEPAGTVSGSFATGAVSAGPGIVVPGFFAIGGLIGINYGSITLSYATGAVTGGEAAGFATGFAPIVGQSHTGGLVGQNSSGTITSSYATGAVVGGGVQTLDPPYEPLPPYSGNGESTAGGLVGMSDGTVSNSYATGTVSQASLVAPAITLATGGLIGDTRGTVQQSYATGAVSGGSASQFCDIVCAGGGSVTGGLAGLARGTISQSYATGAVAGGGAAGLGSVSATGGLIGFANQVSMRNSYATGSVLVESASANIGGLIGYTTLSSITDSYASGMVTGTGNGDSIGGLIGRHNAGTLDQSYATGTVKSTGSGNRVGGLVGYAWIGGTITNSYATGAVIANGDHTSVGGLAGFEFYSNISSSYSIGSVSGTGLKQGGVYYGYGGLVGVDVSGTVTQSYWDTNTSGQSTSAAGTGLTTAQFQSALPLGFSSSIWGLPPMGGFPVLLWQEAATTDGPA